MRILLVSNNFTPYSGGVVSSIQALVTELQSAGHEVELVTLGFLKHHNDPTWVKRLYCPIRFMYKSNYMAIAWRAKKQLAQAINTFNPDIIHVHHPFLLGSIAQVIAYHKKIPVAFTYHTIYEMYAHYVPLPQWLTQWYIKRTVLSFCASVNGIIAPSSYIQHYIHDNHITTPTVVIPSGLLPIFTVPQVIKQSTGKAIQLLTVGRMVKEKNMAAILDVAHMLFKQHIPFKLKLIGYGAQYDQLKSYAYDILQLPLGLVTFIHKPSKEYIVQAYKEADLFLFTSETDTQALVLAEAMAGSTPVIALNGPGQRDIIKPGLNGYIVDSPQDIAVQVKNLMINRILLASLSQGAYQTAQQYRSDIRAKCHISFYKSLM